MKPEPAALTTRRKRRNSAHWDWSSIQLVGVCVCAQKCLKSPRNEFVMIRTTLVCWPVAENSRWVVGRVAKKVVQIDWLLAGTCLQIAYFYHVHPLCIASLKLSGNTANHHQDPLIFLQPCTICGACGVSQSTNGHQLLVKWLPTWLILLPTIFEGKHPSSCGNLACVWFSALIFMTLSSTCAVYHWALKILSTHTRGGGSTFGSSFLSEAHDVTQPTFQAQALWTHRGDGRGG